MVTITELLGREADRDKRERLRIEASTCMECGKYSDIGTIARLCTRCRWQQEDHDGDENA